MMRPFSQLALALTLLLLALTSLAAASPVNNPSLERRQARTVTSSESAHSFPLLLHAMN